MSEKLANLLEASILEKPSKFNETFSEIMVEKLQEKVKERKAIVAESLFAEEDLEEVSDES